MATDLNEVKNNIIMDTWWNKTIIQVITVFGLEPKSVDWPIETMINQRMITLYMLYIICMVFCIELLTIIPSVAFYYFRNYFLTKFTNRYVNLYLRYQVFSAKILFMITSITFFFGTLSLIQFPYYLSTHPIVLNII
jgi:hypothetical protein